MIMMKGSGNCSWLDGDMMHYYVLEGESYEEYYKTVFFSDEKYSREEFEEIICRCYAEICEKIAQIEDFERCGYDLDPEYILWSNEFNALVERTSELRVIKGDVIMSIGTGITPNHNTKKLYDAIDFSKVPHCNSSCTDQDRLGFRKCWYKR